MARVKRAVNAHKKRRSTLEAASGYRGQRSRLYRKAKEQLLHSSTYQYRDRKDRKGDFRQLWITRINAAARANDITYNRFVQGLRLAGVDGRPQGARRARRRRPGGLRRARRGRPRGGRGRGHRRRGGAVAGRLTRSHCSPVLSDSNARLAAARRLTRRPARREAGRFLAEGAPGGARGAAPPDAVVELFATAAAHRAPRPPARRRPASTRSAEGRRGALRDGHPAGRWSRVVPPPRCRRWPHALEPARPRLVAVLVEPNDPGNVGTILRTADAAGADAVVLAGGVDVYNGKARAGRGRQPVPPRRGHRHRRARRDRGRARCGLSVLAHHRRRRGHDLDDLIDRGGARPSHDVAVRHRGARAARATCSTPPRPACACRSTAGRRA